MRAFQSKASYLLHHQHCLPDGEGAATARAALPPLRAREGLRRRNAAKKRGSPPRKAALGEALEAQLVPRLFTALQASSQSEASEPAQESTGHAHRCRRLPRRRARTRASRTSHHTLCTAPCPARCRSCCRASEWRARRQACASHLRHDAALVVAERARERLLQLWSNLLRRRLAALPLASHSLELS